MIELDLKDRKILYELDQNAKLSDSQIGKKVGLSQQVVSYRIKNLLKQGIIRNFYTVINTSELGYSFYKVYFKLQNLIPDIEEKIIDYLVKHKNLFWLGICDGRWDLSISVFSKNIIEFDNILKEFANKFSKFILNKDILIVSELPHFSRAFLLDKNVNKKVMEFGGAQKKIRLDDIDKKILKIISTNARLSYLEIAEKTNLSLDVVRYRIKKLQKEEIIQGFRAWIDLDKINYQFYKVLLSLQNLTEEKEKKLIEFCKFHRNIVYILKTIGSWDLEIEFEIKNNQEFHKAMLELRNQFQNIIRDYETLLVFREYKLNYFPF